MFIIKTRDIFNGIKTEWKDTALVADSYEEALCIKPFDKLDEFNNGIVYSIFEK